MFADGELERIVISPGPGHPRTDSGVSRDVIAWGMGKLPILGVCMGLECIVDLLGGEASYFYISVFQGALLTNNRLLTQVKSSMVKPHLSSTILSVSSTTSHSSSLLLDTIPFPLKFSRFLQSCKSLRPPKNLV